MSAELKPIPVLKGKAAKRFFRVINNGETTDQQKEFLSHCRQVLQKRTE